MKRKISVFIAAVMVFSGLISTLSHEKSDFGVCLYSDICAYINNYLIKSYNIDGTAVIKAADLENYGFDVVWEEYTRTVRINKAENKAVLPSSNVYKETRRAGTVAKTYVTSDITVQMNGKTVKSYNIDGCEAVKFDDLKHFGTVSWNGDAREISLFADWMPLGEKQTAEENPNLTEMYASDGRTLLVDNDEVEAYKAVNWHTDISEVQTTLYSKDGRTLTVFSDEVPAYLNLNWYKVKPGSKVIALTFDDGPSRYTEIILDKLEQYGAKATFFVVGNRVDKYADTLRRTADLGMEIGNHSWDHANLTKLSADGILSQKSRTDDAVRAVIGRNTTLLRPPYGSKNQTVADVYNLPIILWSVDTLDWKTRNAQSTVDAVMRTVKDGDIVLMHDIYEATANAAAELIPKLIDDGYSLVTVSELAAQRGGMANGSSYSKFKN